MLSVTNTSREQNVVSLAKALRALPRDMDMF